RSTTGVKQWFVLLLSSGIASKSTLTKWQLHRICYRLAKEVVLHVSTKREEIPLAAQPGVSNIP
ncbi:hypothetical protein Q4602_14330, partial [Paraglaciecola chathamensis]|uniref:hypothetical protein n=1 Tax=Paraglaciecola chathamensis TaxID=368405 RepID=UPI0026FAD5E8